MKFSRSSFNFKLSLIVILLGEHNGGGRFENKYLENIRNEKVYNIIHYIIEKTLFKNCSCPGTTDTLIDGYTTMIKLTNHEVCRRKRHPCYFR